MTQVIVTDHALVRYIERIHGLDLTKLREEISQRVKTAAMAGAVGVHHEGFEYRLGYDTTKNQAIVTTIFTRVIANVKVYGQAEARRDAGKRKRRDR